LFEIIFHTEAEAEFVALPTIVRAKMAKVLKKLEADPRKLREPDTKPLGNGLFEIRTMGSDIARGIWVYQTGQKIFMLRIFVKKTNKTPPGEMAIAWQRLEELKE
jgi:phage-related protein